MLPLTYKRVSPSLSLSKRESLRLPYTKESAMKSAIYTPKLLPQKRVSLSFFLIYNGVLCLPYTKESVIGGVNGVSTGRDEDKFVTLQLALE